MNMNKATTAKGKNWLLFHCFKRDFYLLIHERHTHREAETQAEGEAGAMQGARRRTPSRDPRITSRAEGR